MPKDAYLINTSDTSLYWDGYNQGIFGLSRRNLYTGRQSEMYDQGYDEGLSVYNDTKVTGDTTRGSSKRCIINEVIERRNKIDELQRSIQKLEQEIRELEVQR